MRDIQTLNQNPLNQLCRTLLRQELDALPYLDEYQPYSLNLVGWVLEVCPDMVPVPQDRVYILLDNVHLMYGWKDLLVVQAHLLHIDPIVWDEIRKGDEARNIEIIMEEAAEMAERLAGLNAAEVGASLAESLYWNLSQHLPGLR